MTVEHSWTRHLTWVLVTVAHLIVFPYSARLNNPNENVRVWTTKALVDHRTFALDAVEREWGFTDDKVQMGTGAAARTYSSKAPGLSLLGVPVYLVQSRAMHLFGVGPPSKRAVTLALRWFGVALPLGVFFWALSGYLERFTRSAAARDTLVVALGLGSLLYPYGVMFAGHAHGAVLAFTAFMLLVPADGGVASRRALVWAGVCAGAAVLFEYQVMMVSAALAGYAAWRYRRGVGRVLLGALPSVLVLSAYHTALFGRPWSLPWAHVQNAGFAAYHAHGFLGLTAPRAGAIGAMLFAPELGLFVFSPYLAVGVLGLLAAVLVPRSRWRPEAITALAGCTAMLLFISSMTFWRGGWCAGPRYVTVLAPFLTWGVALVWRPLAARAPWALVVLAALVMVSVFTNGISAALYPHYPPQLDNPIFDLALPLLDRGFLPYGLGRLLGLRSLWALAPVALVLASALVLAAGGEGEAARDPARRAGRTALAAALAAVLLLPLSAYGRKPNPAEAQAVTVVEQLWEPPPARR